MFSDSFVLNYQEGVDKLAREIFYYRGEGPYIAVIEGVAGIGKTHFGREVVGRILFNKRGKLTKPHDLERDVRQEGILEYYLIENHDADDAVMNLNAKKFLHKTADKRVLVVSDLAAVLNPPRLTLGMVAGRYGLVVENPR